MFCHYILRRNGMYGFRKCDDHFGFFMKSFRVFGMKGARSTVSFENRLRALSDLLTYKDGYVNHRMILVRLLEIRIFAIVEVNSTMRDDVVWITRDHALRMMGYFWVDFFKHTEDCFNQEDVIDTTLLQDCR
jgi:hypothetical protein